jgi:hypothetical protein
MLRKSYASGGGIYGTPGFIGCMRRITIDGQYKMPIDWRGEEISNPEDILVDSCQMHDRYLFVDYICTGTLVSWLRILSDPEILGLFGAGASGPALLTYNLYNFLHIYTLM